MLRCLSTSATAAAAMVARRTLSIATSSVSNPGPCRRPLGAPSMITPNPAAFRSSIVSFPCGYRPTSFHRSFSSGDDDDDGATTDLASALETFWSPAVQLQLQSAAAALPSVQDSLSSLTPGGPEYVKQMRRVETLATLERMLQQLTALQADSLGMEALAQEAAASGDAAMGEEAQAACKKLAEEAKGIKLELLKFLVPSDDADSMDAILELRAGVGGGEASLWCADMCSMYQRFCEQKGWDFEIVSSAGTESGGMREVSVARARDHVGVTLREQVVCTVSGSGAFGMLRFESGVHRVQRVPETEKMGRVHTSTATVAVMPVPQENEVVINNSDLKIDTFRSSGPGGQSVQKTDSAVRITHVPSGVVVSMQDERSQHKNRAKAMSILRSRLFQAQRDKQDKERSAMRLSQVGSAARSDKVRTYNFAADRVKDHRIGLAVFGMDEVLNGQKLDVFIDALALAQRINALNILTQADNSRAAAAAKK